MINNCVINLLQEQTHSVDEIVAGSAKVTDGHSYCMELISQQAITTLTVTCFLLQDYLPDSTMLQVQQNTVFIINVVAPF